MATSTTTESRSADRRKLVPLLLSSFPLPPSHIPTTPLTASLAGSTSPLPAPNPPLSRPPASPLPPVPGPSPITEHETLMFISAARSRRASKMSVASSAGSLHSKRDSLCGSIIAPISPTNSHFAAPSASASTRSIRSLSSSGSASHASFRPGPAEKSPILEPSISEEPAHAPLNIDELCLSSPRSSAMASRHIEFTDTDDEESVLELGYNPAIVRRRKGRGHRGGSGMNDSISSIDMRDLPALQEDETDPIPLSAPPSLSSKFSKSVPHQRPNSTKHPRPPTAVMNKELPPLPGSAPPHASSSMSSRSGSFHSPSGSLSAGSSATAKLASRAGAESPDIATIIAATPRPKRKSSTHFSSGSTPRSRPSSTRSRGNLVNPSSSRGHLVGDGAPVPVPQLNRSTMGGRPAMSYGRGRCQRDDDDESDYGELVDGTGTRMDMRMLDRESEARLERELEGFGSDDEVFRSDDDAGGAGSDSSIDVQTPLPSLMLRDGMLSPHSKILPQSVRATTPHDRHMSVSSLVSTGSAMTKTGIYKDERNTFRRRVRHRDGALLKGGIGLTTGLGWSDSEDEDAPSALTRRISSLVLTRRASSSSLASSSHPPTRSSSHPSPLSRSVSDTIASGRHPARDPPPSAPPTSWHSRLSNSSASSLSSRSRNSGASSVFSTSSCGGGARRASEGTMSSSLGHIREQDTEQDEGIATPSSSASTASLPMPLTPVGDDDPYLWGRLREQTATLKKDLSSKNLHGMSASRERTQSSSSNASLSASLGHARPITPSSGSRKTPVPRPLRLPQASGLQPKVSQSSLRAPSTPARPVAGVAAPSSSVRMDRPQSSAAKRHPVTPTPVTPTPKLPIPPPPAIPAERKPRIGSGMAYKTSSGGTPRPTMMRVPSSKNLRSAANAAARA